MNRDFCFEWSNRNLPELKSYRNGLLGFLILYLNNPKIRFLLIKRFA